MKLTARILIAALGGMAIAWGISTYPRFKRDADVNDLAARILRGETFQPQQMLDEVPNLQATERDVLCDAQAFRSDAVIRMRMAEYALGDADVGHLDSDMTAARAAITKALSCSPTDSYLWLGMLWLNSLTEGFRPSDLGFLRMSYQQGPNEGWVMITRNYLALGMFASLPPDLADLALKEFSKLLQREFVASAVDIFVGPGWPIRELLLNNIKDVSEPERRTFAELLEARGYDIHVPGIEFSKRAVH